MANFKRQKTRRRVRCTLCTPHRWEGNSKRRLKMKDVVRWREMKREANA